MLSKRLEKIASLVKKDIPLIDIGTDHAKIPIYLLKNNLIPHAILTDINEGPLERAKENCKNTKIENVSFILSNGLEKVDTIKDLQVIIAGMGGSLIREIIKNDLDKFQDCQYLILQPMKHLETLREFLQKNNFKIVKEYVVQEENKFYRILQVEPGKMTSLNEEEKFYGKEETIVKDKNYINFLEFEIKKLEIILNQLTNKHNKRRIEILRRLNYLKKNYESFRNYKTN